MRPVGLARRLHSQEGGQWSKTNNQPDTLLIPGWATTKGIPLPGPTPPHKSRDPCGKYRAGTLAAKCVYISDTARHTRAIQAKLSRSPCRAKQRQAQNEGGGHEGRQPPRRGPGLATQKRQRSTKTGGGHFAPRRTIVLNHVSRKIVRKMKRKRGRERRRRNGRAAPNAGPTLR